MSNRIEEIRKSYSFIRKNAELLGDKVGIVVGDVEFLLTALDEARAALEKNKSEWEIVAKQNETFKAMVAWQMARDVLKKYWSDE